MAYDEHLADRIREILGRSRSVSERKMFGGLCFMFNGNMVCGVLKDEMVAKIPREDHNRVIAQKHVRSFDFTGKPMVGIVYVGPGALRSKKDLSKWVELCKRQARARPPKKK